MNTTYPNQSFNTVSLADAFLAGMEQAMTMTRGVAMPWWPRLDHQLFGLRPYEFTLLCAPTGAGKTELLAQLSAQMVQQSVPHFVAPVEIGERKFALRIVGALTGQKLANGEPIPLIKGERIVSGQIEALKNAPCYLSTYDGRVDVQEMADLVEWHVEQSGAKVAILDNLNFFLKPTRAQDALIEMDEAVNKFVMLCKRIPVHTILVVHPKKTDGGRVESEFDIKGSSTAVQEASNVLLFNRPDRKQVLSGERRWSQRELVFKKLRERGEYVNQSLWMEYINGRYLEID